ncbi:MAG: hypothetical protein ABJF11_15845 [Reichenbachiella sp.]|uniref:hypothetical protein n=1 Tax=Reichenbachiella sp. TaxID=2184521 RepID=UPI003264700F
MIKLRQIRGRLQGLAKVILSSALLLFIVVACDDDEGSNTIDEVLYIDGPASVAPASTVTFTAAEAGGDVTWTVTGDATVSASSDLTADITFGAVGTATVSASGSGLTGTRTISIDGVAAEISGVTFTTASKINDGGTDVVTMTFAGPLASVPTVALTGDFTAGTISELTEVAGSNMTQFEATVTGGSGNGQLNVAITGVTLTADYGGATADLEAAIHEVDNVAPFGALTLSTTDVNSGTAITFTMTLNEGARANGDAMIVDLTGAGTESTPIEVSLVASEDPAVWTGSYTIAGTDEGTLTAVLDAATVVDMAGNAPTELEVNGSVNVDNTAPSPTLTAAEDPAASRLVKITPSGDAVLWIWLAGNSQFVPESTADFEGEGQGTGKFVASPGEYKLYYMEVDAAGNASAISRYPADEEDFVEVAE